MLMTGNDDAATVYVSVVGLVALYGAIERELDRLDGEFEKCMSDDSGYDVLVPAAALRAIQGCVSGSLEYVLRMTPADETP